jgi:hypothetical protein
LPVKEKKPFLVKEEKQGAEEIGGLVKISRTANNRFVIDWKFSPGSSGLMSLGLRS